MDLAMALADAGRRRPRGRQRPGRRPLRRRPSRARTAGGCCAATRSARCSAHHLLRSRQAGHLRHLDRLLVPARQDGGRSTGSRTPRRSPASSGSAGSTGLAFGYEEALGYCVDPEHVRDKDGVSALLLLCELAAGAKADGPHPDRPARRHRRRARPARHRPALGAGRPTSPRSPAAMDRLRAHAARPTLGGLAVRAVDDLGARLRPLPPTDGLRYRLADGARVIVRPSGTEPKLKCYLEVVVPVDPEDGVDAARIAAAGRLDALATTSRPPPASDAGPSVERGPARRARRPASTRCRHDGDGRVSRRRPGRRGRTAATASDQPATPGERTGSSQPSGARGPRRRGAGSAPRRSRRSAEPRDRRVGIAVCGGCRRGRGGLRRRCCAPRRGRSPARRSARSPDARPASTWRRPAPVDRGAAAPSMVLEHVAHARRSPSVAHSAGPQHRRPDQQRAEQPRRPAPAASRACQPSATATTTATTTAARPARCTPRTRPLVGPNRSTAAPRSRLLGTVLVTADCCPSPHDNPMLGR